MDWEMCDLASGRVQIRPDLDSFGSVLSAFFSSIPRISGLVARVAGGRRWYMARSSASTPVVECGPSYTDMCSSHG